MLKLENLTIRFGGLTAVDNVTTHVKKGEIFGLVGPNGAGKTTTFNMISGYYAPTSARLSLMGRRFRESPSMRSTAWALREPIRTSICSTK